MEFCGLVKIGGNNMNSLIKKILTSLILVFAFATASFATLTPYCIRVYCKKDVNTKLRTAQGHGMFLSAQYDSDLKAYLIPKHVYNRLVTQDCQDKMEGNLFGTNADKLESIAAWVTVAPAAIPFQLDERCQKMEK